MPTQHPLPSNTGAKERSLERPALLLSLILASTVVGLRLCGTSAWDLGDGALHYLQVHHASAHPELFFDRWAKPLFVLLAFPFAQGGPLGLVVFDALIAVITSVFIVRTAGIERSMLALLVPLLLLFSIQYLRVTISGLTEPLFGLLTVLCVFLIGHRRCSAALAFSSFLPFTRPEYVAFLPFLLAWALRLRQWRSFAWLVLGPTLYGASGWLLLGDRFLHFSRDPYQGSTLYEAGPWDHFVRQAPSVLGEPLLVFACIAIPVLLWLCWKDVPRREDHLRIVVLCVLPVLGIWAAHSYAYGAGGHASAGLLRVLSTTIPLTVLFVVHTAAHLIRTRAGTHGGAVAAVLVIGHAAWAQDDLRFRLVLPAPADGQQRAVTDAAQLASQHATPGSRSYAMHPYFSVVSRSDPWDTRTCGRTNDRENDPPKPGDRLQWDPEYTVDGTSVPTTLLHDTRYAVLGFFSEGLGWGHTPFGAWLFERTVHPQAWYTDTVLDLTLNPRAVRSLWKDSTACPDGFGGPCGGRVEFPFTYQGLMTTDTAAVLVEWRLYIDLDMASGGWIRATFSGQEPDDPPYYHEESLGHGATTLVFHQGGRSLHRPMQLLLWDPDHRPFRVKDLRLVRRVALRPDTPAQGTSGDQWSRKGKT